MHAAHVCVCVVHVSFDGFGLVASNAVKKVVANKAQRCTSIVIFELLCLVVVDAALHEHRRAIVTFSSLLCGVGLAAALNIVAFLEIVDSLHPLFACNATFQQRAHGVL